MFSNDRPSDSDILTSLFRTGLPVLIGSMLATTSVAVAMGIVALYRQVGFVRLEILVRDYFWIIFWTGLAEGCALLIGILAFFLTSRRIVRPLVAISRTVDWLATTGQSKAVETAGPIREINQLAGTINRLNTVREQQLGEIRNMTRTVLHDLRAPIAHIRHQAELVHDGKSDAASASELIAESCNTLLNIVDINSEISLNYADAERIPACDEDLADIAEDIAEMYAAAAEVKSIAFTVLIGARPIIVRGHRFKFQRLIANLLDNAFKFTPENGSVALAVTPSDGGALITISDSGVGIPAADQRRIYERFYRSSATKHEPGNGLGLSLVHAIVTFYRGSISCSSAPGKGTTFKIRIPSHARSLAGAK